MKNIEVLLDNVLEKEVIYSKEIDVNDGDRVIVNIDNILHSGIVVAKDVDIETKNSIVRVATDDDLDKINQNREEALSAISYAKKLKDKLKLDMNFVDSYYTFDRKQLYFLFVADNRVDFRELARSLADRYRTRIELRQIGVRDKAKKVGGIGPCGLFLCCNTFLTDFNSVSINMAKNQGLALNPTKINGVCGRLLCCLNYENETYKNLRLNAPKIGNIIETEKGKGKVVSVNILKQTCVVELNNHNNVIFDYSKDDEKVK